MEQDARDDAEHLHKLSRDELVRLVLDLRAGKLDGFEIGKFEYVIAQMMNGRSARSVFRGDQEGDKEKSPSKAVFNRWLADTRLDQKFGLLTRYDQAMLVRAFDEFEYMFEIADDGRNDWMEVFAKDGEAIGWKVNGEAVQRSKLRVDLRKWALARMDSKRFSEKADAKGVGDQVQTKVVEYYPDPAGGDAS